MHPSLAVSHLHKLPLVLRRRAMAAVDGNIKELEALNRSPPANAARLLPVYYSGLDTAAIPSLLAQLDLPEAQRVQSFTSKLTQVAVCLQGLLLIESIPGPLLADLWERVWPWLEFLDTYKEHFSGCLHPAILNFSPLMQIITLGKDAETAVLMHATPGFHTLIFRAWALSFDQTKLLPKATFNILCVFMQTLPLLITDERDFEEAIEGSGGSIVALARLCVNHVKCVVPCDSTAVQPTMASPGVLSMRTVIVLLQRRCEVDTSFQQVLLDQGLIPAFTSLARLFSSFPQDGLFNLSWAIKYYFRMPYGHNIVTVALRAGLLDVLLKWGKMSPPKPQSLEQLDEILISLSRSSVYLSFLLQLRASIQDSKRKQRISIDSHTFQGFPVSEKWKALWSILQSRWDLMEAYLERDKTTSMSSCSNVECCAIARKSEFKRCSGCKACKYCSEACQMRDWQRGHRKFCGWDSGEPETVERRDQSFIRVLLHHDYMRMKRSILTDELAFLRSNPGTPFYVKFDYYTPYIAGEASVEAVSSFPLDNAMWRYQNARVKESGGRLEMHAIRIADGGCDAICIFQLCSATRDLRTGLEILAAETHAGDDTHEQLEIQRLAELDILEVYP
ncbi:hypothetical protein B0H12DRAFT_670282 [Mycena haematopus]|nr:hypothetical protein B0H12DRAFT_670282 [Mycena haematopus]